MGHQVLSDAVAGDNRRHHRLRLGQLPGRLRRRHRLEGVQVLLRHGGFGRLPDALAERRKRLFRIVPFAGDEHPQALLRIGMESGGHLHRQAGPVQRGHDMAPEHFRSHFRQDIVDPRQGIFRIQAHVESFRAIRSLMRRPPGQRLVMDRLAGLAGLLRPEAAQVLQQRPAYRRFVQVAHQHEHSVIHPGKTGLEELRRLRLRSRIQGRRILPRRIAEAGIHQGIEPVFHGLFFPAVTREQSPTLPRNSNGRLDFPGPTEEEA